MQLSVSTFALALHSCLLAFQWTSAEMYTALADLEDLLKTESTLLKTVKDYIAQQDMKLAILKRQVAHYAEEQEKANQNPTEYLANPINAYLLVKRLTTDWKNTEDLLQDDLYQEIMDNLTTLKNDLKFPTDEDLNGAAIALTRLQDTYNLDTTSLASGELNGIKSSTQLSSDDCFELGRQSYYNEDFYHTVLWMQESLRKYDLEKNDKNLFKWEILEYLAFSLFKEGRIKAAYELTRELLFVFPNHERAKGNLEYYKTVLEHEETSEKKKGDDGIDGTDENFKKHQNAEKDVKYVSSRPLTVGERTKYEMLCRRELTLSSFESSRLKCRYVHKDNPYLLIAPLKEEEAYLNPNIFIYHEAIYPEEIETIKRIATPRLRRATVQNHKTGALEAANYRISKSAWLKEDDHKFVANIRKRVEDMTSLTVETAEELQVVNYGIGGHYEPHFDFARKEETNAFKSLGTGNRIATVLFYMSDVAQGGATVFPLLNLSVWPQKGSAAFWMNLHSSGNGNHLTRHAACPVLQGSKWVSNVWLHEVGQEFRRPCVPSDATAPSV